MRCSLPNVRRALLLVVLCAVSRIASADPAASLRQIDAAARELAGNVVQLRQGHVASLSALAGRGLTGTMRMTLDQALTSDNRNFAPCEVTLLLRGGEIASARCVSPRWNTARHEVDVSGLAIADDGTIRGELKITLMPDGWIPPSQRPANITVRVDGAVADGAIAGSYAIILGEGASDAGLAARRGSLSGTMEAVSPQAVAEIAVDLPTMPDAPTLQSAWQTALRLEHAAEALYRQARAIDVMAGWDMAFETALSATPEVVLARGAADDEAAARAAMDQIHWRISRMNALVLQAIETDVASVGTLANSVAPEDERFGPWYAVSPLSVGAGGHAVVPAAVPADGIQRWQYIDRWDVLGPLPRIASPDLRAPRLPEGIPAPGVTLRIAGADAPATWREVSTAARGMRIVENANDPASGADADDVLELHRAGRLECPADTRIIASTTIESPTAQTVWLAVGFDHGKGQSGRGQLWVNGRLVWAGWDTRPQDRDNYAVFPQRLEPGENHIVLAAEPLAWNPVRPYLLVCTQGSPMPAEQLAEQRRRMEERSAARRDAHAHIVGFRRDGTGQYSDATPPAAWDVEQGINIQWVRDMEGHTTSSPIAVGDRLFTANDPYTFLCLDKHTGRTLWTAEVNPFEEFGPEAADTARRLWLEATDTSRELTEPYGQAFLAHAAQHNHPIDRVSWGLHWQSVGPTHPTPVSDGEHVWVRNAHGAVACFDMEGNRRWFRRVPSMGGAGIVSPMLVDDLLILQGVDAGMNRQELSRWFQQHGRGQWVLALDAASGEPRWKTFVPDSPWTGEGGFGQPVAIHLSDGENTETLIANCWSVAIRASDGRVVIPTQGLSTGGSRVAQGNVTVEGDTAYWLSFDRHGGAIRYYMLDPDTFGAHRQWYTATGHNSHGATVKDGIVYDMYFYSGPNPHRANIPWTELFAFDIQTGRQAGHIQPLHRQSGWPHTSPVASRDYLYCPAEGSGHGDRRDSMMVVRAHERGAHVWAESWIYEKGFPDSHRRTRLAGVVTGLTNASGGNTLPLPDGERLYYRLRHTLYCIGYTEGGRRYEAEAIGERFLEDIGRRPMTEQTAREIAPAADYEPHESLGQTEMAHNDIPAVWLSAGSLPASLRAEQALEALGGPAKAFLQPGTEIRFGDATATFAAMTAGVTRTEGVVERTGQRFVTGRLDLVAGGVRLGSTGLVYGVYHVNRPMVFRFTVQPTATRVWLAGEQISSNDLIRVRPGVYPILMEARIPPFLPAQSYLVRPLLTQINTDQEDAWVGRIVTRAQGLRHVVRAAPGSRQAITARRYLEAAGLTADGD